MQAASCTDPLVFVPSHHCHQQPLLHPPTWCSFWSALFLSLNLRSAERPVRLCLWRSCKRLRKTRYWGRGNFGSVVIVLQPLRSLSASRLAPANGRHKTVGRFGESFADARHRRSDCSLAGWLAYSIARSSRTAKEWKYYERRHWCGAMQVQPSRACHGQAKMAILKQAKLLEASM